MFQRKWYSIAIKRLERCIRKRYLFLKPTDILNPLIPNRNNDNLSQPLPKTGSFLLLFPQQSSLNFAGKQPPWTTICGFSFLLNAPMIWSHLSTMSLNVVEAVLCFLRKMIPSWGWHSFFHKSRSAVSGIPLNSWWRADFLFSVGSDVGSRLARPIRLFWVKKN